MRYIMEEVSDSVFTIEKHMESNGFFRNAGGSSKVGEIGLVDETGWRGSDLFDVCGNYDVYYMEFGCISGFGLTSYRGEAPRISIGDKKHNIPIEDRIKFFYETLSFNENYNCLAIIYEYAHVFEYTDHVILNRNLFEINKYTKFDDDIVTFNINDL